MKKLLQPKYILIFAFLVAAFFLLRKEFEGEKDVLITGDQSGKVCPVHNIRLILDTVEIHIRKEEPDSAYFAIQKKYFPRAEDTLYLLEWLHGDSFKNVTRSQVWYCPACREAKKKYQDGQILP
jgi:hypothetical protein